MEDKKINLELDELTTDPFQKLLIKLENFVKYCETEFKKIDGRLAALESKIESRFSLARFISSHKKITLLTILVAILLVYAYGEHQRGLPPRENPNFIVRILHGVVEKHTGIDIDNKP